MSGRYSTYLARLYPRERDRVRLVIARLGTDPAILEPTPMPVWGWVDRGCRALWQPLDAWTSGR